MAINLDLIINKSSQKLQKNILGGVKKESAVEAIKSAANETFSSAKDIFLKEKMAIIDEKESVVRKYQQIISEKDAKMVSLEEENARITIENNKVNELINAMRNSVSDKFKNIAMLSAQLDFGKAQLAQQQEQFAQKAANKSAILRQIQKAFDFKLVKKTSSQSVYARTNRNGAIMQKVYNKNNELESIEVKLPGDYYRKTFYEQTAGKPVAKVTYTNTTGVEKFYKYPALDKSLSAPELPKEDILTKSSSKRILSKAEIKEIMDADYLNKSNLNIIDYIIDENQITIKALKPKTENVEERQNKFKKWLNAQLQIPEHLVAEKKSEKYDIMSDTIKYKNDNGIVEKIIKYQNTNEIQKILNFNPKTGEQKEALSLSWQDNCLTSIFIDRSNGNKNTRICNIFFKDNEFDRAMLLVTRPSKGAIMKDIDKNLSTSSLYFTTYKKKDIPILIEYVDAP